MKQPLRIFTVLITTFLLILSLSACTAKGMLELSDDPVTLTDRTNTTETGSNAAISLDQFKSELQKDGLETTSQTNGEDGYNAALAFSEDQTRYIYMDLPDEETARSLLTDADGDGAPDSDLTLVLQKDHYEIYTQENRISEVPVYSKSLLAGSMIIVISGPLDNKDVISSHADDLLIRLGFDLA